ncbi:MAG: biotin/lipoyl-binding protein [Melioribacteraceae bacterium]|nr:biotin/lipoyl-binding protein [Melioribacteraceae bacterium]
MKKFKFKIHGNKYDVEVLNVEDNIAEIDVNGTTYTVEVDKDLKPVKTPKMVRSVAVPSNETAKSQQKTSSPSAPKGVGTIKSPLPGVILNVLAKEGQPVKIGDRILILEAMKMENNIEADKEGIIKSIKVKAGDSVLEGDLLVEIGRD